jgi:hypothetical protein
MLAAGAGLVTAAGAVAAYTRGRGGGSETAGVPTPDEDTVVVVGDGEEEDSSQEATTAEKSTQLAKQQRQSWKESAGRVDGREGYVFGDLTRGVAVKLFGSSPPHDDDAIELAGDTAHTQVQRLVLQAVRLFRLRGYVGTVNMSHTVAYFTESVSVRVEADGRLSPTADTNAEEADIARLIAEDAKAGPIFATLLSRLQRRAQSWRVLVGSEGLDPNLTSSAQVGFALPVIKLGWGVSVSLTVSASSLLRWSDRAEEVSTADPPAGENGEAERELPSEPSTFEAPTTSES